MNRLIPSRIPASPHPDRPLHRGRPCSPRRGLALALSLLLATLATAPAATNRLNVLFLVSDDLRPELGCYGNPIVKTPNIDRLAARGLVFNRAYCQQAWCSPSRTSLLTGVRPDTARVWDLKTHFRDTIPDVVTLPQWFKNHGYVSQGLGKIYHGGLDDPASWSIALTTKQDILAGRPNGSRLPPSRPPQTTNAAPPAEDEFKPSRATTAPAKSKGPAFRAQDEPPDKGGDGLLADRAILALQKLKRDGRPFFLAVGFDRPHLPFVAPKHYFDLYRPEDIPLAPNPFLPSNAPPYALHTPYELWGYEGVPQTNALPDDYARQLKHAYYACVSYVDAQIGRILAALDRLELRDNTLVILWGDHGWKLGEHQRWCKNSNFEDDVRSPLIIAVPGQPNPGAKTDALVEFVDIYPSLAELCGLPLPAHLEGLSFKPLLENPRRPWKTAAFSQYPSGITGGKLMGYAMRTDRYRFVRWVDRQDHSKVEALELYDHRTDPQENVNLATDPAMRELVEQLTRQSLAGWKAALPQ